MKKTILAVTLNILILLPFIGLSSEKSRHHKAHVHGVATLDIVFDKNKGQLEFRSPLEAVLGFEHAPKTEKEIQALKDLISDFESNITKKINLKPELACNFQKETIEILKEEPVTHSHSSKKSSQHSDFLAKFQIQCATEVTNTPITLNFSDIKGIKKLAVTVITNKSQKSFELKGKPQTITID